MNVLIVGGAGFVGSALTDILINSEHSVRVYDSLLYEDDYFKNVPFIFGDIRNKDRLLQQLNWADAVVWLAAIVGDGACAIDPDIAVEVNQEAVKWLASVYDGRIVFPSTCSVYGAQDGELTEESPTRPLSVYASTKLACEDILKDKNAIIFRLGTLFGLSDRHSRFKSDLVVNTLTARAVSDGRLKVFGGEQYRPLLHVRDAAQAMADNLTTTHTGIFNLHKENVKILDIAQEVFRQIPHTVIETVDVTFEDSRNYKASSQKAQEVLGFSPETSVRQGIREVKELLQEGRVKQINNPRYSNESFLKENHER